MYGTHTFVAGVFYKTSHSVTPCTWHILLDNGLNHLAEIYFSQEDADTFNNKMNQSFAAAVLL